MKKIIRIWMLLIICSNSYSQKIKIIDISTRQTIPGVNVYTPDLKHAATSDANGMVDASSFQKEDSLIFKHISYQTIKTTYAEVQKKKFVVEMFESAITLEGAGIVANRWEEKEKEISYRYEKISRREVSFQNPQTAADLLESGGYAYIQKSQLAGGSPMLRGFATNRVLLVVDGVRMNNAIFRSGNVQNVIAVDANSLEGTEILFGPGAVMYGSDAIGGVMDFHTLEPKTKSEKSEKESMPGSFFIRSSSANFEKTGHLDFNIGLKKWAFLTAYTYSDYDDLKTGSNGNAFFLRPTYQANFNGYDTTLTNPDPKIQRNSAFSQINFIQKILFQPDSLSEFEYGFYYSVSSDAPRYDRLALDEQGDGILDYADWYYGPQKWMMNRLNYKSNKKTKAFDRIRVTGAWQEFEESRHDRKTYSSRLRNQTENVSAFSLNIDMDKKLSDKFTLYYGLEGIYNVIRSIANRTDIFSGEITPSNTRYPDGSTWASYSAYGNIKYKINPRWIFNSGIRYSMIQVGAKFDTTAFPFPFTESKNQFGSVNGSAGIIFTATEMWNIYLNVSTGFRAPNIDDIGKVFESEPGSVVVPNINLKPEYAYNAEIGTQKIFGNFLKAEISVYYTLLDNALARRDFLYNGEDSIMYDGTLSRVQAIQNISNAFVYGTQCGIEMAFGKGFGLRSVINYQFGREFSVDSSAYYPLSHAAPIFGNTHFTYQGKKIRADLYANYNSKMNYEDLSLNDRNDTFVFAKDENGNPFVPSWYTLNFKIGYFVNKMFSFYGGIENITDQLYRTFSSGISAPGRNYLLTAKISF